MANQVIVTNTGNVQVALTPPPNVQVQISRAVVGTISNVPTANFANFAGNVTIANQPNITSLGTLTTLSATGTATFGNVVVIGNLQVGNLIANTANFANFAGEAFNVSGSNVTGAVANATYANAANTANLATFATTANAVAGANVSGVVANANYSAYAGQANTSNLSTFATTANAVAGDNVSGIVANANYASYANIANTANSVAVANVSGIGNIAVINLDGNASNILFGNGVFGPESGNLNANYANFAGTAFNVSGSNVTGEVANAAYANAANTANLATFATTANAVAGANVSGTVANATFALDAGNSNLANTANSVAVANVSGIGNIATVNLDGNASNILYGNGVFATTPIISNVANANYANFAGEAFNVNASNITGTVANANYSAYAGEANTANLATFATTANSVAGANVSGTVANATFALDAGNANLANLATYATTANSVAGANVSGEVANANFASYSNIAATANSVALANVVGIGNIANINLDGSSSNVLFGNGVFAPESTSIANANYANFAGNLINGTSNISIPTANGTIAFSVNNVANVTMLENGGVVNAFPTSSVINMLRINTFGNPLSDAHRIAWARARGSNTSPTSVNPGDNLGALSFFGHNGTSYQTNSASFIRARVDSSYTANGTNIPVGFQLSINDTNGGINNQNKTHNFWANGNVTFANSVFVTDSLSVTGNITSGNANLGNLAVANFFSGDGSLLSNINGANVSNVANANFAAYAGNVTVSAQPNITSVGNLVSLNVLDSANVTGTIQQLAPNTITITTNATSNTAYDLTTIYGETSNIVEPGQRAIIRSRGNVSTPATVAVNDVGSRDRVYFYNGTTNAIGFTASVTLSNLNSNSNAFTTGASYSMSTGNPNGDQGNANANSAFNTLSLRDTGQLILLPGANSSAGSMLNMFSYGQPTNIGQSQGISFSKARGNRDGNLSVNAGDTLGRLVFQGHNGSAFVTNRLPVIRSTVDSTYVANSANIPAGFQFLVNDNTTTYTHNFYANGNVQFSNGATFGSTSQDTIVTVNGNNANGYVQLNGVAFSVIQTDANSAAGYSPFFFRTFQSNTDPIPASKFFRGRGTISSTTAVVTGDQVALNQYAVYADSGNTYKNVFEQPITITGNDGAGNVTANYNITSFNTGSNINLQANTYANSVSISSGGFMKLSSYTAAALTAITGQVGWMAAVTNSAGGSHPNGMIAFWDTTNTRWSYVHDNSAV
jgi:hypothetical protein